MKLGKLQPICDQVKGRVQFDLGQMHCLSAKTKYKIDTLSVNVLFKNASTIKIARGHQTLLSNPTS